ncbi:MAG TPA: amidase family protein, partial [Bryobacteraceae bacterium]|nr:amidase family protein [Bryobacteraceae bacterium]
GPEAYTYHAEWITKSPEKYQPSTRRALQRAADSKADVYIRARNAVEQQRRSIRGVFENVDLLITPTMLTPPPPIQSATGRIAVSSRNTSPFDVFGLPTISIPCGFSSSGLPIGLQISGAPFAEPAVLALAHAYEQATQWHTRKPPLPA